MITFVEWYASFPRKCAKKDAEKAWDKLTDAEHVLALAALPDHIRYWRERDTEQHWLPLPATWLRGARWDDVLIFERRKEPRPETARDVRASNVATLTGRRHERQPDADGAVVSEFPLALRKPG